jgi:DNA-binding LacI/PurR family transcriptional regulator
VNIETRKRVEAVARELNYKVDRHASSLRTQRAGTLALLLFEDPTPDESHINPFFLSMLGSITRACSRHGHDLLVSFQQLSNDWHADYENSKKADGLILLGYGDYLTYQRTLEELVDQGTRFVRWGAVLPGQPGVSIGCDNFHGGQLVGDHLFALGRRQVAFLGDASTHYPEFFARYRGCGVALHDRGGGDGSGVAGRCGEFRRSRLRRGADTAGAWAALRCGLRRQRSDRARRDACARGTRASHSRRCVGGRLRRYSRWRVSPIRR